MYKALQRSFANHENVLTKINLIPDIDIWVYHSGPMFKYRGVKVLRFAMEILQCKIMWS